MAGIDTSEASKIRILHIVGSMHRGGVETFIMNVYRNINRELIQFDFLLYSAERENTYIDEIESLGGIIYVIPSKTNDFLGGMYKIFKIVKRKKYNIVCRHVNNSFKAIDLFMAKLGGCKHTILHAHSTKAKGIEYILGKYFRWIWLLGVTDCFSCGQAAGEWVFGKRAFYIINNGIDTNKFQFNPLIREEYRNRYKLKEKMVIGHVGRFVEVKNQKFLIKIALELKKRNKDFMLVLVGDGKQKEFVYNEVIEKGLLDNVLFLGVREDVSELYQMFDVMVMPSLYEGFPVTLVEAQAAGLPCVVSDTISHEVKITDLLEFIDLKLDLSEWVNCIERKVNSKRINTKEIMDRSGYSIEGIAKDLEKRFVSMQ